MRACRRLLICGLLGVVTSVVVAWGLALWLPHRGLHVRAYSIDPPAGSTAWYAFLSVDDYSRPGMYRRYYDVEIPGVDKFSWAGSLNTWRGQDLIASEEDLIRSSIPASPCPEPAPQQTDAYQEGFQDARGWPALALWSDVRVGLHWNTAGSLDTSFDSHGGLVAKAPSAVLVYTPTDVRVLPLRPLWRGFLIDSAVFGAAWFGVSLLVARMRRRPGRCARCGYDLAGLPAGRPCPECGTEPRRGAATVATNAVESAGA